jgi:hypothetical protein
MSEVSDKPDDGCGGCSQNFERMQKGVGVGDIIARVTAKFGIAECEPCAERRRKANRVRLSRRGITVEPEPTD